MMDTIQTVCSSCMKTETLVHYDGASIRTFYYPACGSCLEKIRKFERSQNKLPDVPHELVCKSRENYLKYSSDSFESMKHTLSILLRDGDIRLPGRKIKLPKTYGSHSAFYAAEVMNAIHEAGYECE